MKSKDKVLDTAPVDERAIILSKCPHVSVIREKLPMLRVAVDALVVKDAESEKKAADYIVWCKKAVNSLEADRLMLVKPLKEHAKMIDGLFAADKAAIIENQTITEDKVRVHRREVEAARQAEERRLLEAQEKQFQKDVKKAEKKGVEPPPPPPMVVLPEVEKTITGRHGALNVVKTKKWRICLIHGKEVDRGCRTCVMNLAKVPDAYKDLALGKIHAARQAEIVVPGIEFYDDESFAQG